MNKKELVQAVAAKTEFTNKEVDCIVTAAFNEISDMLAEHERVQIYNFGIFEAKERAERTVRNPRIPGEIILLPRTFRATFKPAKDLKEKVK